MSSAIEDLVQRGLGELTSEGRSETLGEELTSLKAHVSEVEAKLASVQGDRKAVEAQLEAYKTKASLALSAQKHAQFLEQQAALQAQQIDQLRIYLSTNVAVCKNCRTYLRLYDIGQRRCAFCGHWGFDWVAGYQPQRAPSPPGPPPTVHLGEFFGTSPVIVRNFQLRNANHQINLDNANMPWVDQVCLTEREIV